MNDTNDNSVQETGKAEDTQTEQSTEALVTSMLLLRLSELQVMFEDMVTDHVQTKQDVQKNDWLIKHMDRYEIANRDQARSQIRAITRKTVPRNQNSVLSGLLTYAKSLTRPAELDLAWYLIQMIEAAARDSAQWELLGDCHVAKAELLERDEEWIKVADWARTKFAKGGKWQSDNETFLDIISGPVECYQLAAKYFEQAKQSSKLEWCREKLGEEFRKRGDMESAHKQFSLAIQAHDERSFSAQEQTTMDSNAPTNEDAETAKPKDIRTDRVSQARGAMLAEIKAKLIRFAQENPSLLDLTPQDLEKNKTAYDLLNKLWQCSDADSAKDLIFKNREGFDERFNLVLAQSVAAAEAQGAREVADHLVLLSMLVADVQMPNESKSKIEFIRALVETESSSLLEVLLAQNKELVTDQLVGEMCMLVSQTLASGQVNYAEKLANRAELISHRLGDLKAIGNATAAKATLLQRQGLLDAALNVWQQAIECYVQANDRSGEGLARFEVMNIHLAREEVANAIETGKHVLSIFREVNNKFGEAMVLGGLGGAYCRSGDLKGGILALTEGIALLEQAGAKHMAVAYFEMLGATYQKLGEYRNAAEAFEGALEVTPQGVASPDWLETLTSAAHAHFQAGNFAHALDHYQEALSMAQTLGDHEHERQCWEAVGGIHHRKSNLAKAVACFEQTLKLSKETNSKEGEISALGNIGMIHQEMGRLDKALEYQEQALYLAREKNFRQAELTQLNNLSNTYVLMGEHTKALDCLQQALSLTEDASLMPLRSSILGNLGRLYRDLGDLGKALEYTEQAYSMALANGDTYEQAVQLNRLALISEAIGDFPKAQLLYERSMEQDRILVGQEDPASVYGLAQISVNLGELSKAAELLRQSYDLYRVKGDLRGEANCLSSLGILLDLSNDPLGAERCFNDALELDKQVGFRWGQGMDCLELAAHYLEQDKFDKVLSLCEQGLQIAELLNNPTLTAKLLTVRGDLQVKTGDYVIAYRDYHAAAEHAESIRASLPEVEQRMHFAGGELLPHIYSALILLVCRDSTKFAEAIEFAERAKGRAFLDLVAIVALNAVPTTIPQSVLQEEQRLLQERQALLIRSMHAGTNEDHSLTPQLRKVQQQLESTWNSIDEIAPEYTDLRRGKPARIEEIRSWLANP